MGDGLQVGLFMEIIVFCVRNAYATKRGYRTKPCNPLTFLVELVGIEPTTS